jgi:hypothetical protein
LPVDSEKGRREIWPEPVQRYVDHVIRPVLTKAGVSSKETNDIARERSTQSPKSKSCQACEP